MDWISKNVEWVFSGIGLFVVGGLINYLRGKGGPPAGNPNQSVVINNQVSNQAPINTTSLQPPSRLGKDMSLAERKLHTHVLFIDDDAKFHVVKILSNSGWKNTSLVKDAITLDDGIIFNAHILFVDVQGVGKKMGFESEGLGLAQALIEKYPSKKIVIYSIETQGNRFHEALRKAASFLPKNADPYEFQKLVEELSRELTF